MDEDGFYIKYEEDYEILSFKRLVTVWDDTVSNYSIVIDIKNMA